MRQRVTIAMALACGPELLIADEPTTALDVTVQAQILDLLQDQQTERAMAMMLVTHDLGVVAGRTDEIIVMYAGQVVEKAPTPTLFKQMRMPYTEALLQSIPRIEDTTDTRLQVIPGRPPDLADPPVGCRFAPRCSYTQDKCRDEEPPLVSDGDHEYRCWFPVGTPKPRSRPRRNVEPVRGREGAALMAGTGTAHLRDDDPTSCSRVERPRRRVPRRRRAHRPRRLRHQLRRQAGARPSASSASPARASRRTAGPSCSCRRPTSGPHQVRRPELTGARTATSCARSGRACRWSSRTRSRR